MKDNAFKQILYKTRFADSGKHLYYGGGIKLVMLGEVDIEEDAEYLPTLCILKAFLRIKSKERVVLLMRLTIT